MLRILEVLVLNATSTTYEQLLCALLTLDTIKKYWCKEAVVEGLVPKLEQLRDLIGYKI